MDQVPIYIYEFLISAISDATNRAKVIPNSNEKLSILHHLTAAKDCADKLYKDAIEE